MKRMIQIALCLVVLMQCSSKPELMEIPFADISVDSSKRTNTIRSIQKVDDFFIVSYFDDYDERLEWLHNYFLTRKDSLYKPSGCSLFAVKGDSGNFYFGRNFDDNKCGILFGKYSAPGKYKSFSFSRLEDFGFNKNIRIQDFSKEQIEEFLCFPFLAEDGINEHGLAIGVAAVNPQIIMEKKNRKPIFLTFFIRKVLDHCKSIDDVINFSKQYFIYDNSLGTISNHILVADSAGKHLVIEYNNGKMKFIQSGLSFEILTNSLSGPFLLS